MNYEHLFDELRGRQVRVALTGANGGFGRTFLAPCRDAANVALTVLCDRDLDGLRATLSDLGFPAAGVVTCTTEADVRRAAGAGRIALIADPAGLALVPHDIVVEATGRPEVSVVIAERAIRRRVHVGMVTKETDSVVGPWLGRLALDHGVVYTTVDGDQPANLIGLVTWARVLGFEIIAAGKSSEYDFVFDPDRAQVTHSGRALPVAGLADLWRMDGDVARVLAARRAALSGFPQSATPDYCEMNVVVNSTGLVTASDTLSYPICRASELADVFVPEQDGGILSRTGVVDVFNCLRREDEASFGGGVFVIVRCTDRAAWQLLRQKGHLVGHSGKYACIYQPFHLMGLESLMSVYSAVLHRRPSGSAAQASHAVMVARARRDLRAGETLAMGGHFHEIEGVVPRLVPASAARGSAPYYLAADKRLTKDVRCGADVTVDALDVDGSALYVAWRRMND